MKKLKDLGKRVLLGQIKAQMQKLKQHEIDLFLAKKIKDTVAKEKRIEVVGVFDTDYLNDLREEREARVERGELRSDEY